MIEVVSSIGVLVVAMMGVLILVQATPLSEVLRFAGRVLLGLLLTLLAVYVLKVAWTCVLAPWLWAGFASLKALLQWLTITLVALIALLLIGRIVVRRFER